jgi:hypothetical protein
VTVTAQCLADGALTGSQATYYTAAALTTAIIKAATLTNNTGAPVAVSVWLNPRTSGTDRPVIDTRTLSDEESYPCPELINHVIEAGGTLDALGLNVVLYVSGVEIV